MTKVFLFFIIFCCFYTNKIFTQDLSSSFKGIYFQAIATDINKNVANNRHIYIESSLIRKGETMEIIYNEFFNTNTTNDGIFTFLIGKGNTLGIRKFENIDWAIEPMFLNIKVSIYPNEEEFSNNWNPKDNLMDIGTFQFWTVPYSLYSANVKGIDLKLNIADTSLMLINYKNSINSIIKNSDTTKYLATKFDLKNLNNTNFNSDFFVNNLKYKVDSINQSKFNAYINLSLIKNDSILNYNTLSVKKISLYLDSATSINIPNTLVKRDSLGNFAAGVVAASLAGNASTSTSLKTPRIIGITGDINYTSQGFDGSSDVTGVGTLANTGVVSGTYGTSTSVPSISVDSKGRVTNASTVNIPTATISQTGLLSSVDYSLFTSALTGTSNATSSNVANTLVKRDSLGNFAAGVVTASLAGNASTSTSLKTARTIGITGDLSYSTTFDGSSDVTGVGTLANTGVVSGTYGTSTSVPSISVDSKGRVMSASTVNIPTATISQTGLLSAADYGLFTSALTGTSSATSSNVANTIVKRDGSGNFAAGVVTASLAGNASTSTSLKTPRILGITGDINYTSQGFDGSSDVTGVGTLASTGVVSGTYGTSTSVPSITIDSKGRVTSANTINIPTATISQTGLLSAADYSYFTSKNDSISNPVTGTGTFSTGYAMRANGLSSIDTSSMIFQKGPYLGLGKNYTSPEVPIDISDKSNGNGTLRVTNTEENNREILVLRRSGGIGGSSFVLDNIGDGTHNGRKFEFFNTDDGNNEGAGNLVIFNNNRPNLTIDSIGRVLISSNSTLTNYNYKFEVDGPILSQGDINLSYDKKLGFLSNKNVWFKEYYGPSIGIGGHTNALSVKFIDDLYNTVASIDGLGAATFSSVTFPRNKNVWFKEDYGPSIGIGGNTNAFSVKFINSLNNTVASINALGGATFSSVTSPTFIGTLSGNASTTTTLQTPRTIGMTGDINYTSQGFDGSSDVTGVGTLANTGVVSGTYGTSTSVPSISVDSKGRVMSASTVNIPTATISQTGLLSSVDYSLFTNTITANSNSITAETSRATLADNTLSTKINSATLSLTSEVTRATNAEALKVNISDTSSMLGNYLRTSNYGLIKSSQAISVDSSLISTKLWRQKGIDSIAALDAQKVKYIDTTTMLSGYKTFYPRTALSFSAGSGSYSNTSGVITIPTNTTHLTNSAGFITLSSLSGGSGISYSSNTGVIASSITQYVDANARAAISLSTTGSSGAATYSLTTGVINIPNYTLSGLGGQTQLNGTGFVKSIGTTISYDNTSYLPLSGGTLTGSITASNFQAFKYYYVERGVPGIKTTSALINLDGYYGPVPGAPEPSWNVSVVSIGDSSRGLQIAAGHDTHNLFYRKGFSNWQSWDTVQNKITLTTGGSGAATLSGNILNIPTLLNTVTGTGSLVSGYALRANGVSTTDTSSMIYQKGPYLGLGKNYTSPSVPVDISDASLGNGTLRVTNTNGAFREILVLRRPNGNGGSSFVLNNVGDGTQKGRKFEFFTTDNGNGEGPGKLIINNNNTPNLILDSSGNILISSSGTTIDPYYKLEVNGKFLADDNIILKNSALRFTSNSDVWLKENWGPSIGIGGNTTDYSVKFVDKLNNNVANIDALGAATFSSVSGINNLTNQVLAISANTTLAITNKYINCIGSTNFTITLPKASDANGREYWIRNPSVPTITLNITASTGGIAGFVNLSGNSQTTFNSGIALHLISDGTNWLQY